MWEAKLYTGVIALTWLNGKTDKSFKKKGGRKAFSYATFSLDVTTNKGAAQTLSC